MSRRASSLGLLAVALLARGNAVADLCADLAAAEPETIACDAADDAVYDDGWQAGDDGGFGWDGGWTFATGTLGTKGAGVASSTANGDLDQDGDLDLAGRSWRLFGQDFGQIRADRVFSGGLPYQTPLSLEIDAVVASYPTYLGFELSGNPLYAPAFQVRVGEGGVYQVLSTPSLYWNTGVAANGEPVRFDFTRIGYYSFRLDVTPRGGATRTIYGGMLPVTRLRLFVDADASGAVREAFFNRITLPEPDAALAAAVALTALSAARRRAR